MKTITINNNEYKVPTSWEDISVAQQVQVETLAKQNPDFETLAIIAGYCSLNLEELKTMNLRDIKALLSEVSFLATEVTTNPVTSFTHGGTEFHVFADAIKSRISRLRKSRTDS